MEHDLPDTLDRDARILARDDDVEFAKGAGLHLHHVPGDGVMDPATIVWIRPWGETTIIAVNAGAVMQVAIATRSSGCKSFMTTSSLCRVLPHRDRRRIRSARAHGRLEPIFPHADAHDPESADLRSESPLRRGAVALESHASPDTKHRGVEQLAARRAHNPEVAGSNPAPATRHNQKGPQVLRPFLRFCPDLALPLVRKIRGCGERGRSRFAINPPPRSRTSDRPARVRLGSS